MAKKTNPAKVVADIREKINDLKRQRRDIERAPVTKAEAETAIDRFIEHHTDKYRSRGPLAELAGRGRLSTLAVGDDLDVVMAFYFPGETKQRLLSALEYELADGTGKDDRRDRLQSIADDILEQERSEEQIIQEAEEQGLIIQRRGDADPRAVIDDTTE